MIDHKISGGENGIHFGRGRAERIRELDQDGAGLVFGRSTDPGKVGQDVAIEGYSDHP